MCTYALFKFIYKHRTLIWKIEAFSNLCDFLFFTCSLFRFEHRDLDRDGVGCHSSSPFEQKSIYISCREDFYYRLSSTIVIVKSGQQSPFQSFWPCPWPLQVRLIRGQCACFFPQSAKISFWKEISFQVKWKPRMETCDYDDYELFDMKRKWDSGKTRFWNLDPGPLNTFFEGLTTMAKPTVALGMKSLLF